MTPPAPSKIGHFRIIDQDHDGIFGVGDRIVSPEGKDLNLSCGEVKGELKRLGISTLQGLRLGPVFWLNRFRADLDRYLEGDGSSVEQGLEKIESMESSARGAGAVFSPELKLELQTRVLLKSVEEFWRGPRF